jgi:hypothetical protein
VRRKGQERILSLISVSTVKSETSYNGHTDTAASIWPLIAVADWIGGVLAEMMRAVITARGHLEWNGGDLPVDGELFLSSASLRVKLITSHDSQNTLSRSSDLASPGRPTALAIERFCSLCRITRNAHSACERQSIDSRRLPGSQSYYLGQGKCHGCPRQRRC